MPTEVQIYKNKSIVAEDIADTTITAAKIADTTITAAKIADKTITDAKIADKTITDAKIADKTITDAKIADTTITAAKLSFSLNFFPVGGIIMWSGTATPFDFEDNPTGIPTGWVLCDGSNSTPDLRNRFVVGAHSGAGIGIASTAGPGFSTTTGALSSNYTPGNIGGFTGIGLTIADMPSHSHGLTNIIGDNGGITVGSSGHLMNNNAGKTTTATGGDQYHENRPPYYALAFIMKTS